MNIARPNRVTRSYVQSLAAEPSRVFPLLCPVREAEWLDGWDPLLVLAESGVAEPDCVFVTQAGEREALWYITRHEPDSLVEMIKITPELTACRLTIGIEPSDEGSQATVTYSHTSLGPDGDAFVDAFTEDYYRTFMEEWELRLNYYLSTGEMVREEDDD